MVYCFLFTHFVSIGSYVGCLQERGVISFVGLNWRASSLSWAHTKSLPSKTIVVCYHYVDYVILHTASSALCSVCPILLRIYQRTDCRLVSSCRYYINSSIFLNQLYHFFYFLVMYALYKLVALTRVSKGSSYGRSDAEKKTY